MTAPRLTLDGALTALDALAACGASSADVVAFAYSLPAKLFPAVSHVIEDRSDRAPYADAFKTLCEGTDVPAHLCQPVEISEASEAELSGSFADVPANVLAVEFPALRREWDADRQHLRAFRGERCLATASRRRVYSTGPAFTISTADGASYGTAETTLEARTVLRAAAQAFENRGCLPACMVARPLRMVPQVAQQQQAQAAGPLWYVEARTRSGQVLRRHGPFVRDSDAERDAYHAEECAAIGWNSGRAHDDAGAMTVRHVRADGAPAPAMVPQQVQQAQARDLRADMVAPEPAAPAPAFEPTRPLMRECVEAVTRAGLSAYMREPGDTYLYFTDGERIGYLQTGSGRGVQILSVHIPHQRVGSGYSIEDDLIPAELTPEVIAGGFQHCARWVGDRDRALVRKWSNWAAFQKANAWNGSFRLVAAGPAPLVHPLPEGTRVRTIGGAAQGDWDTDSDDEGNDIERRAAPGEIGTFAHSPEHHGAPDGWSYSVEFQPSGAWVFLHEAEISDASKYEILPPAR